MARRNNVMQTVDPGCLRSFASEIIASTGTPWSQATIVGNSLVDANLAGHDSHGVQRLPPYVASAAIDDVFADVVPVIERIDRATVTVDAGWGWGQPAFALATEETGKIARSYGVGVGVVHRCYHVGRLAPYVESLARAGFVALAMSNGFPAVAPYGGYERVLGTNPIAWAVPRGNGRDPVSFDIATSGVAEGKLQVALAKEQQVAPGLIVDVGGNPSTEPWAFYDGGALLPFGGHKGFGFLVLAQLLGCGLAGLDTTKEMPPREKKRELGACGSNGPVLVVIDVGAFAPLSAFNEQIEKQCELIRNSPPAAGFDRVYLPGEKEVITAQERASGIPVPDSTWNALVRLGKEQGVPTNNLLKADAGDPT
jgi:uncharacterized oxidoreductase